MSSLFDAGVFDEDVSIHRKMLNAYKKESQQPAPLVAIATKTKALLIDDFAKTLCISLDMIGPERRVFELGFTSMDLIRLKRRIDTRLGITMSVITLMKSPTA